KTKSEEKKKKKKSKNKPTSKDSQGRSNAFISFFKDAYDWLSGEAQLTEEDRQEIENRLARYDYSSLQIQLIAGFGQIYEQYKQIFFNINSVKSVSSQEEELKKKYSSDRSKRELDLNETFLKTLDERMNNDNPLFCVIKKCHSNELKGNIDTTLKPIRRLMFSFGDFTTQESRPDHLELKQAVQKNNEFDIRGNEELVFAYGLANNEVVLVVSIDRNVSDSLPVEEEINKEEKYSDDDKTEDKQDMWSERYNQNCITKIFLSSRQTLNKKKKTEDLGGKMTLAALSEQKHSMVLYERAKQLIHVYKWNERIADSLQKLKNKTINLRERVLPDGFYVTSMCFDNKDDNLYILDNTNTIYCIALDTGLFNNEREIVCKERYSKVMVTLEGGYIVGIKPHEQEEEKETETEKNQQEQQSQMQPDHDDDIVTEGNIQTSGETPGENGEPGSENVDTKEGETQPLEPELTTIISTANIAAVPPVRRTPTGFVQCDFYVLDDSKELVRSFVLPKEFMPNEINDIRFKLILQKEIYVVSLDNQFILHCLPLQVSLKKSQLHVELTSMYGDLTNGEESSQTKKPSKLDYIEYKFYSQSKLTLHLSVLLDANENKSSSWISKERLTQASELVLHACDKVNRDTKKIFTHLDWKCTPIAIDGTNKQIDLKDVLKLVINHRPSRSGVDFIRQVIMQFPMQIARASGGDFVLLHNGENDQARYARCTTNSKFVECIRFGGYDALINSWQGKIRV
ncbi:Protein kinase domain containing protein, partial [Reticulomyxa filosa]